MQDIAVEKGISHIVGEEYLFDPEKCIHEYVDEYAKVTPNAVAVICGNDEISYFWLSRLSTILAAKLHDVGVVKNQIVAISMERSIESIISVLAIHKLGAAYLPINPKEPEDRFSYFLDDAGIKVLLVKENIDLSVTGENIKKIAISIDLLKEEKFPENISLVLEKNQPEINSTAYIIYTSGSTGRPKGVEISRFALSNYIHWTVDYLNMIDIDGAVVSNPFTFDAKITSIYPPLVCGKTVVLPSEKTDILAVFKALTARPGTYLFKLISGQIQNLTNMLISAGITVDDRKHVFVIGGDKLSIDVYNAWRNIFPNSHIGHSYGPTETVCGCTLFDTNKFKVDSYPILPIGKPIYNTELFVLDDQMRPVNIGEKGELYIGGNGVAKGYLNKQELTNERFFSNSSLTGKEIRLYKTGDFVLQNEEGFIEFLGRMDNQVKVGGYRIELGEIERQIQETGCVKNCIVLAATHQSGMKAIFAYLIRSGGRADKETKEAVHAYLLKSIPPYMIPTEYFFLDSFTLTPNGKMDRKDLPVMSGFVL